MSMAPQHLSVTEKFNRMLCALMPLPLGRACFILGVLTMLTMFVRFVMAWYSATCTSKVASCPLVPVCLNTLWQILWQCSFIRFQTPSAWRKTIDLLEFPEKGRHTGTWTHEHHFLILFLIYPKLSPPEEAYEKCHRQRHQCP